MKNIAHTHPDTCNTSPSVPLQADPSLSSSLDGLVVVGDIHGSLNSLQTILLTVDRVLSAPAGTSAVIFVGDYVDRGKNSLEVILLLLLYALAAPDKVFLLRGNHESYRSFSWGFNTELHIKFPVPLQPGDKILNQYGRFEYKKKHPLYVPFLELFNMFPLGALVTLKHHPPLPIIPTQLLHGTLGDSLPLGWEKQTFASNATANHVSSAESTISQEDRSSSSVSSTTDLSPLSSS